MPLSKTRTSCFNPRRSWTIRDRNTTTGLRSRVRRWLTHSIQRNQTIFLNRSFTNRTMIRMGMIMKPFVETRPAEQMTTKSHDGISSQFKTDIASKVARCIFFVRIAATRHGKICFLYTRNETNK